MELAVTPRAPVACPGYGGVLGDAASVVAIVAAVDGVPGCALRFTAVHTAGQTAY